jgi:hypothetical protein
LRKKFANASRGGTSAADNCVPAPTSYLVCGSYISSRANASTLGSILISPLSCDRAHNLDFGICLRFSFSLVTSPDQAARSCADQNLHNYIRGVTDHAKRTCSSVVGGLGAKAERTTNAAVWRMWTSSEFDLLHLFTSGRKNQIC